jgi:putative DNA-invertase from lambdoid prophage Rac
MTGARKRAALYLRVSTEGQTTENQRPDLERLAATRGWEVVAVYEEKASAAKRRPEFARMLLDARRGAFDVVAVWALDRFGRSMAGNVSDARDLAHVGVGLVSVQEPWLDTTGPVRDLLLAIFSWVAEQERRRLIDRTVAGMERAKLEGVPIGRPRTSPVKLAAAAARVEAGATAEEAAKAEGISDRTLRRHLKHREAV